MTGSLLVALGAAIGAPLRYLTDRALQARFGPMFPWGTLTVNVVGSLILGLLVAHTVPHDALVGVGTGFCGGLTTYSTFSYETLRLLQDRARLAAAANVALNVLAGLGAAVTGYAVATALA